MAQAARAAVIAGAVEAFRMRKEPGEWKGDKGKRILTSAITAAGTDGIVDKDPNKHGTRHVIESTLAGLATNRLVNGSRSRSRHGRSKSRGRSDSHGAAKGLAATGLLAAAGKEAYDRYQSRSKPRRRSDSRGRSSSRSDDSRERGSKRRSKSVSDYINKGLAALGLEEGGKDDKRRSRRSGRSESESEEESDYSPPPRYERRRGRDSRDVGRSKPLNERALATSGAEGKEGRERGCSCSESDLGNSTDDEGKRKKMRRSTMLASGLATVATIHAAHEVYSGAERRKKRAEMVREGKMTEEEARKSRIKNNITDAAAIGVAALGVKGAYGEWKEVNEKRKETNNFKRECEERAQKRHQRARSQSAAAPRSNNRPRLPDEIEDPDGRRVRYYDDSYYGLQSPSVERDRIYY